MIKLNFTTITPLHISNGEQLGYGLDYVIKNEAAFYKLNGLKIAKKFASNSLFDFSKEYSLSDILNVIEKNKNLITEEDLFYKVLITKPFDDHLKNPRAIGQRYVSEFINSNGNFYVPASSVKGALLTILNEKSMGIDSLDAKIIDKVVFPDSEFIDQSNFNVLCSNNRPPKINMICLKAGSKFDLTIRKTGKLILKNLKNKLQDYSKTQIENALKELPAYKSIRDEPKGADIFEKALDNISAVELKENEFLVNLGFGGGSWFKIKEGRVPKFKSKRIGRNNPDEPAHTSVSFKSDPIHIGWCKLIIEEL